MEPFIADLINNKVPKPIRYIIVILLVGFIMWVGICVGLHSEMLIGNILGLLIAGIIWLTGIYLLIEIYKS